MTGRSISEFLQDTLDAITDIETFTDGIDFETFQANREKLLAVVKSIEILLPSRQKITYRRFGGQCPPYKDW
ncbi:DUF86 domain-containing protein [Scytonema sp. NUACC26]|uniref:HepT-like ribonuclease domain-containing protein n=1 Tax=Scytonema sp. NUACC26 TaxID=3140176 RepID=UPI0034DC7F39